MSYPFIIWTMQRTGGTALTELLMDISEHPGAEHEPFNWDRQFGAITMAWNRSHDTAALSRSLSEILAQHYLIKHTYELRDMRFNAALLEAAAKTSYRHVLLVRRDELARLVSKFVAEANGTWFKDYASRVYAKVREGERRLAALPVAKVVTAYDRCREVTAGIRKWLSDLGVEVHEVAYEDLFLGERAERERRLAALFDFLGFTGEAIAPHREEIEEKIFAPGQDTRSILEFIPNLGEVIAAVRAVGYQPPPGGLGADGAAPGEEGSVAEVEGGLHHRRLIGGMWDAIGQLQFDFLKKMGLRPEHRVLDIGCGCLRAGVKLIPYLEPEHYFGIDSDKALLRAGYRKELAVAGLSDRLPRHNLFCSRLFRHKRLPEGTIDYGICAGVMTHLPYEHLKLCLANSAEYFRRGGKLYVSFFELEEGTAAPEAAKMRPGPAGAYHYREGDMIAAAEGTSWQATYIGPWDHPRGQMMMEYERL